MRRFSIITAILAAILTAGAQTSYQPSKEVMKSRAEFAADRFGIFIHWGIYSMFGQGEWYLNYGPRADEYAKAAAGFYPANFNAEKWAQAIKDSGAKYICFTSRHHDGFSMWDTAESDYNIVKSTPFKRDIVKELADACQKADLSLHLYYSHIDWTREDYPQGRTGHTTGRDTTGVNWPKYYDFMNRQLTELLTNYGPIRAIWFDGWWDHDEDSIPFDWQLRPQYDLIHRLQPACLVGNNHHQDVIEGEDIQIFERDVPGENTAGYSEQQISRLPLETCQTMNGMWGYKVVDTDYKDLNTLLRLLVKTAGMGANLLLNIGPQPSGDLPAQALERLHGIGEWLRANGESIYGTEGSRFAPQPWGTSTRKGKNVYVHVLDPSVREVSVPEPYALKSATSFPDGQKLTSKRQKDGIVIQLPEIDADCPDYIVKLTLK